MELLIFNKKLFFFFRIDYKYLRIYVVVFTYFFIYPFSARALVASIDFDKVTKIKKYFLLNDYLTVSIVLKKII